jgi:hypothetical protein
MRVCCDIFSTYYRQTYFIILLKNTCLVSEKSCSVWWPSKICCREAANHRCVPLIIRIAHEL